MTRQTAPSMFRKQVPWGMNITIIISNLQIDICYRGWDALNEDLEKNSEKWSFFPKVKYFLVKVILLIFYSGTKTRRFWQELHFHSYIFSRWIPPSWKQRRSVCQNLFHETSPNDEQTITQCSNNTDNFVEIWLFKWYPQSNWSNNTIIKFCKITDLFSLVGAWCVL